MFITLTERNSGVEVIINTNNITSIKGHTNVSRINFLSKEVIDVTESIEDINALLRGTSLATS